MRSTGKVGIPQTALAMYTNGNLLTVELEGKRYRGTYRIVDSQLVVEAHGLGSTSIDATIVDCELGEPTQRLAALTFAQFIKENIDEHADQLALAVQGSTTQVCLLGGA